ncbi:isocitrate/isopropylmalate family dehydrogenase [Paraflavitalea speifideaquila]|uniref:isocitrate/isopropylmalate family dehydrogenase n=1 Tax=Paraflavitalea speifideaquila TaxID=3076558 RepID=UPI0028E18B8C|nr:isocitrate/isopropylmalate family dehydrogenase [Paraflavitalea speifideiaquila]
MANKHILIVPGDGIGQEVTAVGKQVLDRIASKFGHTFTYDEALIGHVAIEATGNPLPDESLEKNEEVGCRIVWCCRPSEIR